MFCFARLGVKGCVPLCVAVAGLSHAGHAQPRYSLDYTTSSGDSADLLISATTTGLPAGQALITGITGTWSDGVHVLPVTGFATGSGDFASPDGLYSLDNLLYLPAPTTNPFRPSVLDTRGFLVYTAAGEFDLSAGRPFSRQFQESLTLTGSSFERPDVVTVFHFGSPPAPAPEPLTLGLGVAGLGMAARRRLFMNRSSKA
ncbi:MAG TPA: hypothetical protein VKT78_09255 [Fimbriimonadaceae bacterium]|nr:hypothetical protein [Fimbriimonadaceae bacterium]